MKYAITSIALLAPWAAAFAGTPPSPAGTPPPSDNGWQFRFAPYLWAQGLDGTAGVRGLAGDVNMDFGDIWNDLDFAFMGAFEARRGRWSILTDFNYAELSDDIHVRDVLLTDAGFKMKQFLGNVTLNWRAMESPDTTIDLYAGTRMNWVDLDIRTTNTAGTRASRSGDDFWADAIIGARFQTNLGSRWFLRVSGDIGAGESDFTWQASGILGWRLNDSCNLGVGYRGLGTDYRNGGFTYDVTASGPVIGAEWKF
jgi:hypothetical protein